MKKTILVGTLVGLIALNLVGTGAREITMLEKEDRVGLCLSYFLFKYGKVLGSFSEKEIRR